MGSRRFKTFLEIEGQLAEERATALTRIGQRLESLLQSLESLARQCAERSGPSRDRALQAYRAEHEQACLYRWYLEVQRESVGLCRHDALDRVFPMPPRMPVIVAGGQPGGGNPEPGSASSGISIVDKSRPTGQSGAT